MGLIINNLIKIPNSIIINPIMITLFFNEDVGGGLISSAPSAASPHFLQTFSRSTPSTSSEGETAPPAAAIGGRGMLSAGGLSGLGFGLLRLPFGLPISFHTP